MSPEALVESVYAGEAPAFAERGLTVGTEDPATLEAILAASRRIGERVTDEQAEVMAALDRAGVAAAAPPVAARAQRHGFSIDVTDVATAHAAALALEPLGYEPWGTWSAGARRSFDHHADHLTVVRTDDVTTVVRVGWAPARPSTRWRRLLRPTPADWRTVTLPTWAWRAYPAVRVARLVLERLGRRPRHGADLGPFLATPSSLLDPLLDAAGTRPDDVVIDVGCGDGRLLLAAAKRGCRAIGVEHDPRLAARARERADAAGMADRVRVIAGDAQESPVEQADVVFVFLPSTVLPGLVPSLLDELSSGARVIAHEQTRLPAGLRPRPTSSRVVVGPDAMTVAHRWDA